MTATTVLAKNYKLGRDYQIDGWYGYINGGDYTDEQQAALVEALMNAQEREFDALLPENCFWLPYVSEIHGPISATLADLDLDELMQQAANAVQGRYDEIEAKALANS